MFIQESSLQLSSQHQSTTISQSTESLQVVNDPSEGRIGGNNTRKGEKNIPNIGISEQTVSVSISQEAHEISASGTVQDNEDSEVMADLNIRILRAFIEKITGKKVKMASFAAHSNGGGRSRQPAAAASERTSFQGDVEIPSNPGEIRYTRNSTHYEAERTEFSAQGTVVTADGEKIEIGMSLMMSREFFSEESLEMNISGTMKDPLVINFEGNAAELTTRTFAFDIDIDGEMDEISFVTEESGFLALDKNGDGVINDGSELFGARSGDGFAELSMYDDDGNGWIDENDGVFDSLRVWTKNASGEDRLLALGQVGIGAIFLQAVASTFSLKDSDNVTLGEIRSTGMYLKEDFSTGTIQQLDLIA